MKKKIGNDIIFYTGFISFKIYDTLWREKLLPLLTKNKENRRKPTRAILPQNDPDYRLRYIRLRQQARYYQAVEGTFIQIPTFQLETYLKKEYFVNIILAGPTLAFSIVDYYEDGRVLSNEQDVNNIVNKFGLIDTMIQVTDDNAYQLNPSFDIMKILDDDTRYLIEDTFQEATFFVNDEETFIDNFLTQKYYFQDCSSINAQFDFDVYGLYIEKIDGEKIRLTLDTIVLIRNDKAYIFQNTYVNWDIIRNNYVNWSRTMSSIYEHQLGSNVYVQSTLFHLRQTMASNHPLTLMMNPFLEGVYFTNSVFTDFGISVADTQDKSINRYMDRVELFDLSNKSMTNALQAIHIKDGYKLLNYSIALSENGVDDIYFEQKELLWTLYDMVLDLVTNIFAFYYAEDEDLNRDPELKGFYTCIKKDFPFLEDLQIRANAITFFTNIIYLSSIKHSKNHTNFAYLSNFSDYALRKTNFDMLLNKLENNMPLVEADLYSTMKDCYSRYGSGLYPSVPLNLFGSNYKNIFTDREVQRFFKDIKRQLKILRTNTVRNNYTEFLFRLQNSNTI